MGKIKWLLILLNLIALLLYLGYNILAKEDLKANGKLVLLRLAPVDPRSLMQGDYMDLRYSIADSLSGGNTPKKGFCVVSLDSNGVANLRRAQKGESPLGLGELIVKYNKRDDLGAYLGAESYFFEEGSAQKYQVAMYGGLKVDEHGNSLLDGLYDEHFRLIK